MLRAVPQADGLGVGFAERGVRQSEQAGEEVYVGRGFYGRWHADLGLKNFHGAKTGLGLPRTEAHELHAPIDVGPDARLLREKLWAGVEAEFSGQRASGGPQRADRVRNCDARRRVFAAGAEAKAP